MRSRLSFKEMGGSRFLFIESKTFEFLIEGGGAPRVCINEMGREIVRSVVMGRECAKRMAVAIDDLVSKPYVESFVHSFRVGDIVLLLQRSSNSRGNYISLQEIHRGGRKGSIIILEGRNNGDWCGFGLELRRLFIIENHTVKHAVMENKPAPVVQEKIVTGPVRGKGLYAAAVTHTSVSDGVVNGKKSENILGEIPKIVQSSPSKFDKFDSSYG